MKITFGFISFIVILVFLLVPFSNVDAQFISKECDKNNPDLEKCIIANNLAVGEFFGNPKTDLPTFIGNIIEYALGLLGTVFIVLILYAGFQWMTAGGNPEQAKKASQTVRNSVIGLIIVILAYAVTITVFKIILDSAASI